MLSKIKKLHHFQILLALCAINLILKLFLWKFSNYTLNQDSIYWLENARCFRNFDLLNYDLGRPGWTYPLLIAFLSFVIRDLETCGILVSILASTFLVIPVFYISLNVFNRSVAILASFLVTLYPYLNIFSIAIFSEATYLAMVMMSVWAGFHAWKSQKIRWVVLSGVLMGWVYLTRAEGIGFGVILGLWFLLCTLDKNELAYKKWHLLVAYGLSFSSLVFLGVLFLHWKTGAWTLTTQIGNIALGLEDGETIGRIKQDLKNIDTYFLDHYKVFFLKYISNVKKIFTFGLPEIFYFPLMLFAGMGLCHQSVWEKGRGKNLIFLILFTVPPILLIPISHVITRYLLVLVPLLLILVAAGIEEINRRAQANRIPLLKRKSILIVLLPPLLILSLSPTFRSYLKLLPIYPIEYKETGHWIKQNTPETSVLFSQVALLGHFSQRKMIVIRSSNSTTMYETKTLDEILLLVVNKEIPYYLIAQERWKSTTLHHLLKDDFHHPKLKRIYVNDKYPKAKVVIYKIL